MVSFVHGNCEIINSDNREDGFFFDIYADNETYKRLEEFILKETV